MIIQNASGISAFSSSKVDISRNVILDNSYVGLDLRDTCRLRVEDNIFQGNERGVATYEKDKKIQSKIGRNTFWENKLCVY